MTDDPVIVIDALNIGSDSLDVNEDILNKVGQNLVASFRDLGFVYLKNHGLPEDVQQQALIAARAFFQRSSSYKREYKRFGRLGFNGYTALGVERTGLANQETAPTDFKECFDIKASKQHQTLPSELCDAIPPLSSHCCRLVERLLSALDKALDFRGVLESAHDGMCFDHSYTTLRLLHYPVIDQDEFSEPVSVTRCAAHTDYGTMTVLFQDNRPGLQVMSRAGHWTDIVPRPGHLLINIGDLVEIWTGGQLKATLHRVTSAGRQGREHPRLSMAFFVHPNKSVVVRPLLGDQYSDKYAAVKPSDFLHRKFAVTYSNYTSWQH